MRPISVQSQRMATAHADIACPSSGHRTGWTDIYAGADILSLTRKADLLLEPNGEPRSIPDHLVGEARERAVQAARLAVWIRAEAHRRGLLV